MVEASSYLHKNLSKTSSCLTLKMKTLFSKYVFVKIKTNYFIEIGFYLYTNHSILVISYNL